MSIKNISLKIVKKSTGNIIFFGEMFIINIGEETLDNAEVSNA